MRRKAKQPQHRLCDSLVEQHGRRGAALGDRRHRAELRLRERLAQRPGALRRNDVVRRRRTRECDD